MKKRILNLLLTLSIMMVVKPVIPAHAQNNTDIYTGYNKILDLYIEDYNGGSSEGVYYALSDVDNNGIKELIIGFGGSMGYALYSFNDGQVINSDIYVNNDIGFYEQNGRLYVVSSSMTGNPYEFEVYIEQIDLANNGVDTIFKTTYKMNKEYYSTQWIDEIPQVVQLKQNSKEVKLFEASDRSLLETLKEIKVVLNGEEIEFDQPPIMAEDRILVPIRKIAEAMGDTVLWNDKYQTAFIKHEDRGLIIKLLEDHIKIVKNEHWTQWEEKELDVMAFSLNGRTLVPVRAFCESLGAEVNWNGDEYTAYITYDFNKDTKEMSAETFQNINTVYYALNNSSTQYEEFSYDFNEFYEQRDPKIDAVTMGVSNIWSGVQDLISGLSNDVNIIKSSVEEMLTHIPDNDLVVIDLELLNDIKETLMLGKEYYDITNGINDEFLKLHPNLKSLNTSINAVGTTYDIASFSAEQLAVFFSNYQMNIQYLHTLKAGMEENGVLNDEINTALSVLEQEYANKYFQVMLNARDELTEFTIKEGMDLVTGGLFHWGVFTWESAFKVTGATQKGQSLKTFYGLFCVNDALDKTYKTYHDRILTGNYTNNDVSELKRLDDMQRALKITTYSCIEKITNDKPTQKYCTDTAKEISGSCILWKNE